MAQRIKRALTLAVFALAMAMPAAAQSRIKSMPGYDQWAEISPKIAGSVRSGAIAPTWAADSASFDYTLEGVRWRFDVATLKAGRVEDAPGEPALAGPAAQPAAAAPGGLVLARGRGREADVVAPDGKSRAFSRDYNIWYAPGDGGAERQISFDGGAKQRIRHGVGSYVYLEEFSVSQPVWWSPDGARLAWMRYDEGKVDDYFLQLDQTRTLSTVLTQAYPHAGANNPVADLMVFDFATGQTRRMDVREGLPFSNNVIGHYIWNAQWTKDGAAILVRRADRLQKHYDIAACDPATGACQSVVRESRPASWAQGGAPRFLEDGNRFIWTSERNDFRNLYLYDLSGKLLTTLTRNRFDAVDVVKVDEAAGLLWYTARSGDTPMKIQLHRVTLDGRNDVRLTHPRLNHRVELAPDGKHFIDVEQAHDTPPITRLRDLDGKLLATVASSDLSQFDALGLEKAAQFTFIAADGQTRLHGMMQFPSNFDPSKKYPVLLNVYGGPGSNGLNETFATANPLAEYGFIILRLDARTNAGRGRKVLDQSYQQLGIVEIDDFAAGIRAATERSYVDATRIGVYGTSYGGSVAALMLMRYPDLVHAAAASSPVTDYRLYDTAYSERYLGLPEQSPAAYDRSAVMTYVDGLKGDLMVYFGTSDDNVHPKNSLQLIRALQAAGKSFEVQVGPDRGHTGMDQTRMMEFFIERLILDRGDASTSGIRPDSP
ncbi:MAG: S9 family peptidase [Hyphomonadaceae bacterium]|nr:S9 family peptidase [Hyphomonadaceae bacterium]